MMYVILIGLCIVKGCFGTTTLELSSCNRKHMTYKATWSFKEKLSFQLLA